MSTTLEKATKRKIGYTEDPMPRCENCKFHSEEANRFVDRMWDNFCDISNMVTLSVEPHGRCKKFQKKDNK